MIAVTTEVHDRTEPDDRESTPRCLSVTLVMPFANPHLLSIFRELETLHGIELSIFVFRDLPQHRLDLGWTTPEDVIFVDRTPGSWASLFRAIRRSHHVVFLGLLDPRIQMPLAVCLSIALGKKIWLASEGFKKPDQNFPYIVRRLLNRDSVSILAIGHRSSDDYRSAGLTRPRYFRFGFAESYRSAKCTPTEDAEDRVTESNLDGQENVVRILGVGQLNDRKNFQSIIRCFPSIHTSSKIDFRICGDGPDSETLRQLAKTIPDQFSVSILGNVDTSCLDREFRTAQIFVMPSKYDGWGVVLNQAVEYHLPCVVSSGVRAANGHLVRHGKNGFIFDDDTTLAKCLELLINDGTLRKRCSNESAKIARIWSVRSMAERLFQVLIGSGKQYESGPLEVL